MTTTTVRRPARLAPPTPPEGELELAEPPGSPQQQPLTTGAGMILLPVIGGAGALALALSTDDPSLAVTGLVLLVGVVAIGVVMLASQRGGTRRTVRENRERYLDYVEQVRLTLRRTIAEQRRSLAWSHPEPARLVELARDDARRWERRPGDHDFLVLRVGTGDRLVTSRLRLTGDTGPLNQRDPVCLQAAQELQARYSTLHDQPVTVDLQHIGCLSVVGDPLHRRSVATGLVLELATLHAPHEVQLAVVRPDAAAAAWDWVKWLPHVHDPEALDGDVPARRVTSSVAAMADLLAPELEERLARRARSRGTHRPTSQLVVIVEPDPHGTVQQVQSPDPSVPLADLGVHVVALLDHQGDEPDTVDDRLTVDATGRAALASQEPDFHHDLVDPGLPGVVARLLAPLRASVEEQDRDGSSPAVGLPELLGVSDPHDVDPWRTWAPRGPRDLLRVPIGVGADGPVMLDLKESAHGGMGPHGLVVGATGSGKSEMLRTLVTSLVVNHGPDQLALMLVDFKGGATFAAMEHLPHVAGVITNLQDDLALVDRMRDALHGELQRRQELLRAAGNLPNVLAYQEHLRSAAVRPDGRPWEPLPHLLVIVDEFSELLAAKPELAELFVAIGRIGRSIGVHLLLATQRLETGRIRGLESHLSYRISLRTFSEAESREAIGVPDAYHLPPEPGTGYLKVDTTVFERFKAALVSAPYVPPASGPRTVVPVVPYVAVNGLGQWVADQAAAGQAQQPVPTRSEPESGTVLDVICRRLSATGAPRTRPVWLDPLPTAITLDALADVDPVPGGVGAVLGLVDDPARQRQFPLVWDFTGPGGNLVLTGSPASGKSVLLATIITSLSLRHAPGDVAFYCIDHGGGLLGNLRDLPHVAVVASRVDPERIHRTLRDVAAILDGREELFARHGLGSMRDLRAARAAGRVPADVPGDVFLVIDGWGTFREEYDALEDVVADLATRGLNHGVHVVLSVTQAMQVRMRMQAAFGGRLELRLTDAFDSAFDRTLMSQVPRTAPGRGLTDVDGTLVFHTALPRIDGVADAEHLVPGMSALVDHVAGRASTSVARVRVLPAVVRHDELPPVEPGSHLVPVGISDVDLGPAGVDLFGSSPHLVVYGDGETGKTNLLKVLVRGLVAAHGPDRVGFVVIDYRRTLQGVVPDDHLVGYAANDQQASQVAQEVAAALRLRVPGPDVTAEQLRERSWWQGLELVVIADDYDLVATGSGNALAPLTEFVAQGRDLGLHLVVSRRVGGLSRALFEPLLQRLGDVGTPGLIFSGDRAEGRLVRDVTAVPLPPGRALLVGRDGRAAQVQTAWLDGDAD
jgi:S-DNA-T family DNA segregation ATPase FtsK/SpoIIIE